MLQDTNHNKMKKKKKIADINFKITLDVNNVPEHIEWHASENKDRHNPAKAIIVSIWDGADKQSLKIDLWTKEMMAEEMSFFVVQILDSLSETYRKSVGDEKISLEIKKFAQKIGKMSNVLK